MTLRDACCEILGEGVVNALMAIEKYSMDRIVEDAAIICFVTRLEGDAPDLIRTECKRIYVKNIPNPKTN